MKEFGGKVCEGLHLMNLLVLPFVSIKRNAISGNSEQAAKSWSVDEGTSILIVRTMNRVEI